MVQSFTALSVFKSEVAAGSLLLNTDAVPAYNRDKFTTGRFSPRLQLSRSFLKSEYFTVYTRSLSALAVVGSLWDDIWILCAFLDCKCLR
jgi:hypothetical protein